MIKAGIIGATGYAGGELVRILTGHREAEIVWYGSRSYIDQKYADVYRNMFEIVDAKCLDDNMEELAKQADVIFTATPQGYCASVISEEILERTKIVDLSADFRIKDVGDFVQVEIEDNGRGIAAKDLPYIFDRFYRADSSRNSSQGGSGIGLSIVKKIVEDHGGRIWATSKEGMGTEMHFVLRKYQEVLQHEQDTDH